MIYQVSPLRGSHKREHLSTGPRMNRAGKKTGKGSRDLDPEFWGEGWREGGLHSHIAENEGDLCRSGRWKRFSIHSGKYATATPTLVHFLGVLKVFFFSTFQHPFQQPCKVVLKIIRKNLAGSGPSSPASCIPPDASGMHARQQNACILSLFPRIRRSEVVPDLL